MRITTKFLASLLALVVSTLAWPDVVRAQSGGGKDPGQTSSDADERDRIVSFDVSGKAHELALHRGNLEAGESRWRLVVRESDADESLVQLDVPRWLEQSHYGFGVEVAPLDSTHLAVLFSATPGATSKPPPSAPEFKAVWTVSPADGDDARKWRHVASAQYSELDGGSRIVIREIDGGKELLRFRPDGAERFCGVLADDTFAYERYDLEERTFVTEFDFDVLADKAQPIDASMGDPEFTPPRLPGWFQWFIASSDARTPDEDESLIRPLELGDFRLEQGWSEGVDGLGGGQFVTAQVSDAVPMTSLRIFPGDGASAARYTASAKPTRLLVALQNGARYTFDVPTADYEQMVEHHGVTIELPEPQRTNCLSIVILDAAPGQQSSGAPKALVEAVTMAEATPYSNLHGASPEQTAHRIVDFIASTEEPRKRERVAEFGLSIGDPLVTAVLEKMRDATPEERRRVIPLLAIIPADEAVPLLVEYLEHFGPGDQEYRAVKRALAAHHQRAAGGIVTYVNSMEDPTTRKYVDMIRLLGRVGTPKDIAVLIDDLGRGDARVRNERVRALAKAGPPLAGELVEAAADEPDSDRSYDALKTLNLIGRHVHYDGQGVLPNPDVYLKILRQTRNRRTLMRALRVAKYFRTEGFVEAVADKYASYPDPLVRREAIAALGRYPGDDAFSLTLEAMKDRSPDVRIAAVETLGERDDAAGAVDELRQYVLEERWRGGLQQAFRTLAGIDDARTRGIFQDLLTERPNAAATLIAFEELNRRGRAVDGARVVDALEGEVSRWQIRLELIDNLGLDDSTAGQRWLIDVATRSATAEPADDNSRRDLERIRRNAILALGRRRSAEGQEVLLDLARTSKDQHVRDVAIRALGFYASSTLLSEIRDWRRSAEPELREKLDDTIDMIDRRISINDAEQDVIDASEELEELQEPSTPQDDSASPRE